MTDVLNTTQRSYCMSRIRGKHTQIEYLIRKGLFALGFRYRLHVRDLPGSPDLVLPKYRAVVFVHGCFWHGHNCPLFSWPASNRHFWLQKIRKNRENDARAIKQLRALRWRVMTVWECALRGKQRMNPTGVSKKISHWLRSEKRTAVIAGHCDGSFTLPESSHNSLP